MNIGLINNWNSVVSPTDTVYHLGDFALGPKQLWRDYRDALNGTIKFILGNHDTINDKTLQALTSIMHEGDTIHDELVYYTPGGAIIHLAHVPPEGDHKGRGYTRAGMPMLPGYDLLMCGHVHTNWLIHYYNEKPVVNVGVDRWGYTPRTLDEILKLDGLISITLPQRQP